MCFLVCKAAHQLIYILSSLKTFCFADNVLFNFQGALEKTKKLVEGITDIHNLTKQLALYFCEDEGKLKLQELLSLFKTFCDQLVKAKKVIIYVELHSKRTANFQRKVVRYTFIDRDRIFPAITERVPPTLPMIG